MAEKTSYQQLQPEERLTIASLHLQGSSMRAMARILGRSPGTICTAPDLVEAPILEKMEL
jgi:IS30 family transposase